MKLASSRYFLTLGIAFGGFLMMPNSASAGTGEIKAIATKLNGGTLPAGDTNALITFIKSKTSLEIANAVIVLINEKPKSAAAYAGEALKQADEGNFGTVLGQRLVAQQADTGVATLFATPAAKATFIGTASKNAATGTGPFGEWIDEFAFELTGSNADAYAAAKKAGTAKTAIGQIVASRMKDPTLDTLTEQLDLAQKALIPTNAGGQNFSASAQEIARYVSDAVAVADVDKFARDLAATAVTVGSKTTQPLLGKPFPLIVSGTVTSNPTEAQEIVAAMFDAVVPNGSGVVTPTTVYSATVKNAATLTKNLGLIADAEEVSQIAFEFGQRIGDVTIGTNGKPKVVGIAQKSVAVIAKNLVTGLATRPPGAGVNGDGAVRYSRTNRLDEIGEVGAYLLAGLKDLQDFQGIDPKTNAAYTTDAKGVKAAAAGAKRAADLVTGLIKTIITASAKSYSAGAAAANPTKPSKWAVKDAIFQQDVAEDAAGSIAQTIRSMASQINGAVFTAIKNALLASTAGKAIGGTAFATIVQNALASGINGTALGGKQPFHIFEDGTIAAIAQGPVNTGTGVVIDAETDIRSK